MDWNGKGGYNGDLPLVRFDCRLIKVVDVFVEDLHRVRIRLDGTPLRAGLLVEGGGGWWLIVWSWRWLVMCRASRSTPDLVTVLLKLYCCPRATTVLYCTVRFLFDFLCNYCL